MRVGGHTQPHVFAFAEGDAGLLAVLQYSFDGANPTLLCPSIGLLVHLISDAGSWQARDTFLLETRHHFSLQKIQMLDLAGRGADYLLVESDAGGAGNVSSSLQVFDLSKGHFEEVFHDLSRLTYMDQDKFTQVLDTKRTLQSGGQQFCTVKRTLFEKGQWFRPPRVTHPCYDRGDGLDPELARVQKELMAPLQ